MKLANRRAGFLSSLTPYLRLRRSTEILLCEARRLPPSKQGRAMENQPKKNSPPIKVYCLPDDFSCADSSIALFPVSPLDLVDIQIAAHCLT